MPVKTGPRYFGHVSDWLRRHDTRKIPRDLGALALVIGVSKNSVKCYLYRRRKEVKDRLLTIPDLRNSRILLTDIEGKEYRGDELSSYEYHVDRFSLHIGITAVSKSRKTNPVFEVPALGEFIRSVKEAVR